MIVLILFVFFQIIFQISELSLKRDNQDYCISSPQKYSISPQKSSCISPQKIKPIIQKQRISVEAFQFFEQILDHFSQGILVLDEQLNIKQTNQSLLDIIKVFDIEEWLQDQRISSVMESNDSNSGFNNFLTAYLLYNDKFKYNLIDRNKNQFRIRNNLLINMVYDHFGNQSYLKSSQNQEVDSQLSHKNQSQTSEILDMNLNDRSQLFCQINNTIYKIEIHISQIIESEERQVVVIFTNQHDNIKYLDKKRKIKAINEQFNQLLIISIKNMNSISQQFNCYFMKSEVDLLMQQYQINSQLKLYKQYLKFIQQVFQIDQTNNYEKKDFQQKVMKLLSLFYYQNQYFDNQIIFKHQKFINMNISLDYQKILQIILVLTQVNTENTLNGTIKISLSVQDIDKNLLKIKISNNGNGFHLDLYQILNSQIDNKFDFFEHKDNITNQVSLKNYIRLCLVNRLLKQVAEKYSSFNYLNYLKNSKGNHFYFYFKAQEQVQTFLNQQTNHKMFYKAKKESTQIEESHYQKYHIMQTKNNHKNHIKQKPNQLKNLQEKKKKYFNQQKQTQNEQSESGIESDQLKVLQQNSDLQDFILNGDMDLNDLSSIYKKQSNGEYCSINTKNMILNFNKDVKDQESIQKQDSIGYDLQNNTYQKQSENNQQSLEININQPLKIEFQMQKQNRIPSKLNKRNKLKYQKSDQIMISNSDPEEVSESEISESIKMYYEIDKCEHQKVQIVTDNNLCIQTIQMIYQKLNIKVNLNIVLDGYLNNLKNRNDAINCASCDNKFRYFLIDVDTYYIEQYLKYKMNNQINGDNDLVYLVDNSDHRIKQMIDQSQHKLIKKPLTIEKVKYINSFYYL